MCIRDSIPSRDLIKLYQSLVLPVLDYTCVVYHSMLTKTQENELEHLQKLALKTIYGVTDVSYNTLLDNAGITSLASRRLCLVDKFLQKAINHPVHSAWFPLKEFTHYDLRTEKTFEENLREQTDFTKVHCISTEED